MTVQFAKQIQEAIDNGDIKIPEDLSIMVEEKDITQAQADEILAELASMSTVSMQAIANIVHAADLTGSPVFIPALRLAHAAERTSAKEWMLPLGALIVQYDLWQAQEQKDFCIILAAALDAKVGLQTLPEGRPGFLAVFYADRPSLLERPLVKGKAVTSLAEKRFSFYASEYRKAQTDIFNAKQAKALAENPLAPTTDENGEFHPTLELPMKVELSQAKTAHQVLWALYHSDTFKASYLDKDGRTIEMRQLLWSAFRNPAKGVTVFANESALIKAFKDCKENPFPVRGSKKTAE